MNINLTQFIKKMMGWCPNAEMLNRKEEYMVSYEGRYVERIKGMEFSGILGILHLVYALWLISTALWILIKVQIFPWYVMDINFISSGILLVIGMSSLILFFNFLKSANIQRTLAILNVVLIMMFFLYLSQSLISYEPKISVFDKPFNHYTFSTVSLILFTIILGIPSIFTFFSKPNKEKKTRFLKATFFILITVFASLGAYYFYLNNQKEGLLIEENSGYKLYRTDPNTFITSGLRLEAYPYFLDSPESTTGHPISKETYEAIQFLRNKERSKAFGWWDYQLQIQAAGMEPVISYASEEIKQTVGRPSLLYDKFESHEKVFDVSRFFTTDSEEAAKDIAKKYGAKYVYLSRQRWHVYFTVMLLTAHPDINLQSYSNIQSSEAFDKEFYEPSMAYKFNTGAELDYFDKIFENKDVIIYQLK